MALQDVFYFVGIIFLSIYSVILIGLIIGLFYIRYKMIQKFRELKQKIIDTKNSIFQPEQIIKIAGTAIVGKMLKKFVR
jgi:hypothetical protein